MATRVVSALGILAILFSAGPSAADDIPPAAVGSGEQVDKPESPWTYLVDGGAIPFLWAPLAGRIMLDTHATPRESPFAFSSDEGGAPRASWQVPGWAISSLGGVSAAGMILGGDASRAYHVKGLAQSLSTGVLVTGVIKVAVGRHRPDWTEDVNTPGSRRSFPSGHATQAFAIATYSALFLRGHVFDKYRGGRKLPWWEAVTYGGIALGAAGLAAERVIHNRHYLSDVAIGSLLGTATSTLFYLYQEGRYDGRTTETNARSLSITPAQHGKGATVGTSFVW